MTRVLMGLNPEGSPDFVSVYIDDVLGLSQSLENRTEHLKLVIVRLQEAGLKLKLSKCHFFWEKVEYLGHVVTPSDLKPSAALTSAVLDFPAPQNVKEVRHFMGLSSYYRRFIPQFVCIVKPLHELTRKDMPLQWDERHQSTFSTLKRKLTPPPILSYPCFDKSFVLETDASGYWQIWMEPNSVERTAFIASQGILEFRVMPFGLMNAPSVFQWLMTCMLMGLNPEGGPDFVSVYIENVLVFSQTLENHIEHLKLVIVRLQEAGLKLKPSKSSPASKLIVIYILLLMQAELCRQRKPSIPSQNSKPRQLCGLCHTSTFCCMGTQ